MTHKELSSSFALPKGRDIPIFHSEAILKLGHINTLSLQLWGNSRAMWDFFSHKPWSHNNHPKRIQKGMGWGLLTLMLSPAVFLNSLICAIGNTIFCRALL